MNPNNTITSMIVYGNQSSYIQPPSDAQKAAGTVPLDTLPADWWNRMWMDITQNMNNAGESLESVYQELKHLLEAAGITPSSTSTSQVLAAVRRIARTIATAENAGAVISSTLSGKVSVDQDGVMTPNGMGTPTQLNTSSKVIVTALNEVLTTLNNYMTTTNSALNGKAPVAHASSTTTYGLGTSTEYGHVKLSSAVDSACGTADGVAATPSAVKCAYDLAQCACDIAVSTNASIDVYCGTTCVCTINGSTALCLNANAFNSTATNATCFAGCTYACAKADFRTGLLSFACTTASAAVNVMLYSGISTVGQSGCCPLTFIPTTGVLKAKTFCGALSGNASTATNATCAFGCTKAQLQAITGSLTCGCFNKAYWIRDTATRTWTIYSTEYAYSCDLFKALCCAAGSIDNIAGADNSGLTAVNGRMRYTDWGYYVEAFDIRRASSTCFIVYNGNASLSASLASGNTTYCYKVNLQGVY